MSKRNQTKAAPVVQEQPNEDLALDQANLEEGTTDANDSGNESPSGVAADGDSEGNAATEEGQEDGAGGPDTDASDDGVGEDDADQSGFDPEAEQLAAALAAAVAPQQPAVPVNDVPVVAPVVEAPVSDAPAEAPVAAPTTRTASVSLAQAPITARVAPVNQAEIKFQLIIDRLQEYATLMAPNAAASAAVGKAQQLNLWRVIDQVLKLEGPEFYKGYSLLLDFVAEYRTAHFSDKYLYRNFGELALSTGDRKNFNRLLHLIVATCDRATRQLGLSQVDLPSTVAGIRDTAVQQRLTEFYQI
jgi:hypothetical protein